MRSKSFSVRRRCRLGCSPRWLIACRCAARSCRISPPSICSTTNGISPNSAGVTPSARRKAGFSTVPPICVGALGRNAIALPLTLKADQSFGRVGRVASARRRRHRADRRCRLSSGSRPAPYRWRDDRHLRTVRPRAGRRARHPAPRRIAISTLRQPGFARQRYPPGRLTGYSGPANFDAVLADGDGLSYIVECNPRFWYTIYLSMIAGLNFR